jgi:hypothetical protein
MYQNGQALDQVESGFLLFLIFLMNFFVVEVSGLF